MHRRRRDGVALVDVTGSLIAIESRFGAWENIRGSWCSDPGRSITVGFVPPAISCTTVLRGKEKPSGNADGVLYLPARQHALPVAAGIREFRPAAGYRSHNCSVTIARFATEVPSAANPPAGLTGKRKPALQVFLTPASFRFGPAAPPNYSRAEAPGSCFWAISPSCQRASPVRIISILGTAFPQFRQAWSSART